MRTRSICESIGWHVGFLLVLLMLGAVACGGGGAKSAVKSGLNSSGFEGVSAIRGSDDAGQLTVEGKNGSKLTLDVVKEGGKFVIERCAELEQRGSSCSDVPTDQPLEP